TTEAGLVHIPFYEGDWAQRLEYLLELPKGKTLARFALTDLTKAKAVLKDHTCIMGGVPHTLLQVASPSEVEEYCKKLIQTCGKNGGFILSTSTGITNEAKPENVKAMIDSVHKYGRY
ncbi:MAG TPA: uroporphyrinogen decarboxylase family protein, partial [Dehalococcoidales bacterium]